MRDETAVVDSRKAAIALCEMFGIDISGITKLTIVCAADDVCRVYIERHARGPNGRLVIEGDRIKELKEEYQLQIVPKIAETEIVRKASEAVQRAAGRL